MSIYINTHYRERHLQEQHKVFHSHTRIDIQIAHIARVQVKPDALSYSSMRHGQLCTLAACSTTFALTLTSGRRATRSRQHVRDTSGSHQQRATNGYTHTQHQPIDETRRQTDWKPSAFIVSSLYQVTRQRCRHSRKPSYLSGRVTSDTTRALFLMCFLSGLQRWEVEQTN